MSRIRVIGLALVAVFAMSAIAAASASAAELEYTVFPNPIVKATQVGEGELETEAGRDVKCTGGSTAGKIETAKTATANSVKFTGCKSTKFGGGSCQSGATKGEIVTNELTSELVYPVGTRTLHNQAAEVFKPKSGTEFVKFSCETLLGAETLKVTGSVVCHIEPVNAAASKKSTLKCVRSASKGVQDLTEYETETGVVTKGATLKTQGSGPETFNEGSSQKSTTEIEVEKAAKIKA
jgi:hypothetical protein